MWINHIFFTDDSLLFYRANELELRCLQNILDDYEKASGQKLNKQKTSIYFSRNTSVGVNRSLSQVIGVPATQKYKSYLGLPALVGRSHLCSFEGLKRRI